MLESRFLTSLFAVMFPPRHLPGCRLCSHPPVLLHQRGNIEEGDLGTSFYSRPTFQRVNMAAKARYCWETILKQFDSIWRRCKEQKVTSRLLTCWLVSMTSLLLRKWDEYIEMIECLDWYMYMLYNSTEVQRNLKVSKTLRCLWASVELFWKVLWTLCTDVFKTLPKLVP